MKIVTLAAPTVVNTNPLNRGGGELRHPIEGSLTVSDDEAKRLKNNNLLACDPEDVPDAEDATEVPEDLRDLKVPELKAKALKDGVPLHDANTKPTIIAAFVAHRDKA